MRRLLREDADWLAHAWDSFQALSRACRAEQFELVLAHGDWPFNLLRTSDGTLHLVDFDELLLAPAERDTWFDAGDDAFLRAYRARHSAYARHDLATAFYVHSRFFEDLVGLVLIALELHDRLSPNQAVAALSNDWMTGLRTRIDEFRDR
jgi:hypothetical protein